MAYKRDEYFIHSFIHSFIDSFDLARLLCFCCSQEERDHFGPTAREGRIFLLIRRRGKIAII